MYQRRSVLSPDASREALLALFRRRPVVDLGALFGALETTSRMSVFRRLHAIGYLISYSHTGRFYTLADIPDFDHEGLWRHQGIGFSRYGRLKPTLVRLVEASDAGRTHGELARRLGLRVHNALFQLAHQGRIGREDWGSAYLYVSANPLQARTQMERRREVSGKVAPPVDAARFPLLVEVLLEVIHGGRSLPGPATVAARLAARGIAVTTAQVHEIYESYALKKTAGQASPLSPR